jgi:hypothetical protein
MKFKKYIVKNPKYSLAETHLLVILSFAVCLRNLKDILINKNINIVIVT